MVKNYFFSSTKRHIGLTVFCWMVGIVGAFAQPQKYWQQTVDYTINVQLDDILHSLDGYETIQYTNHSPDTLTFIWFHLWPNAYKNDHTAFSEQLLRNRRTDFYFSDEEQKGYINRLSFKIDNEPTQFAIDSTHEDIIKLFLQHPLPPEQSISISTPFHVKLPFNFSRGGHNGQTYQITQWYPKPAVYDSKGWHPMPYLDQGEFYSEFGHYDVTITVPENYLVAGSGKLTTASELAYLHNLAKQQPTAQANYIYYEKEAAIKRINAIKNPVYFAPKSASNNKTLHYEISKAHDFAWFASKQFVVGYDTVALTKKMVDVYSFYSPWHYEKWNKSLAFAKRGLRFYDEQVGSYPYETATVVSGAEAVGSGGMEYPSITLITTQNGGKELDVTIAHELGHNWFYGALASNERDHAWMDEGMNSYYDNAYGQAYYPPKNGIGDVDQTIEKNLLTNLQRIYKDQPIDQPSDSFTMVNYGVFVYLNGAKWMKGLEQKLGKERFKASMKAYYADWQFKHPYPENFKQSIEKSSNVSIDQEYADLFTTAIQRKPAALVKRPWKLAFGAPVNKQNDHRYLSVFPLPGYNDADKFMIGAAIHNYQLPLSKLNFIAAPMYATGTNQVNFYGRMGYRWIIKKGFIDQISLNSSASTFTYKQSNYQDSLFPKKLNFSYFKIDPTIRFTFRNKSLLSSQKKFIQLKYYSIGEEVGTGKTVEFNNQYFDSAYKVKTYRQLLQFKFKIQDFRALYPYDADLTIDASNTFLRAGLTAHYFLNYAEKNHGVEFRFFAGKYFQLDKKNTYNDYRYYLTLTGPRGEDDYTYSNYFVGRGEFDGGNSQQLMERDGFMKVGTELQGQIGRTDKWLSALNISGSIFMPLKFFVDLGTYADPWQTNATTSKFLYDAGLQLSLFDNCLNLYVPIFYSKVYRDYYKSIFPDKSFAKSISFSIDIQRFNLKKLAKGVEF